MEKFWETWSLVKSNIKRALNLLLGKFFFSANLTQRYICDWKPTQSKREKWFITIYFQSYSSWFIAHSMVMYQCKNIAQSNMTNHNKQKKVLNLRGRALMKVLWKGKWFGDTFNLTAQDLLKGWTQILSEQMETETWSKKSVKNNLNSWLVLVLQNFPATTTKNYLQWRKY